MLSSWIRTSNSAEALPKRRASTGSLCPVIAKDSDTARASTWQTTASQFTGSARCHSEDSPPSAISVPSPAHLVPEQPAGNTALHYAAAADAADAADGTSADRLSKYTKNCSRTPKERFPEALYSILSSPLHTPIISWNEFGDGFIIHDPEKFKSTLLPEYYRATHFSSFVRQLYAYGFKREDIQAAHGVGSASSKPIAYLHNHFRRGAYDVVKSMKRQGRDVSQDVLEARLSSEYCSRRHKLGQGNKEKENNTGGNALLTEFRHTSHAQVYTSFASPLGSQVDLPSPDAHSNGTLTTTTLQTALEHLGHLETAVRHLQNDKASLSTLHRCIQLLYQQLRDTLRAHSSDSPLRLAETDIGIINGTLPQGAGLSGSTVLDHMRYGNTLALFTPSHYHSAEDIVDSQSLLQPLTEPAADWHFTQPYMS